MKRIGIIKKWHANSDISRFYAKNVLWETGPAILGPCYLFL